MDPHEWLAGYHDRLETAAQGARQAQEKLQDAGASATSPRGEVTVSVNAAGVFEDVRLTPMARKLEADALAGLIVATARQAQRLAAEQMADVMADYLGDGSALGQITEHLPSEDAR